MDSYATASLFGRLLKYWVKVKNSMNTMVTEPSFPVDDS